MRWKSSYDFSKHDNSSDLSTWTENGASSITFAI